MCVRLHSCEFYCVLLYILYCFFSFTYTVYLSVCMSPVYVYGPCCLILNKMKKINVLFTQSFRIVSKFFFHWKGREICSKTHIS